MLMPSKANYPVLVAVKNVASPDFKNLRKMQTSDYKPVVDPLRNLQTHNHHHAVHSTLAQLVRAKCQPFGSVFDPKKIQSSVSAQKRFGWFQGVFVRCILNILGVLLFVRTTWVVGEAGIVFGAIVILLSAFITTVTALSVSAICRNGEMKRGGIYFLVSRFLGPEFGGSIGLIFSLANVVSAAMCIVGFAEYLRDLLKNFGITVYDGSVNDVRIIGLVLCVFILIFVSAGLALESKVQLCLLAVVTLSILNYFVSTFFPVSSGAALRGITGYSYTTMLENMRPDYSTKEHFFTVFAVFFPAVTGFLAGSNAHDDLRRAQEAVPKGTLLSIAVTTLIYLSILFTSGATCVRHADGVNPIFIENYTYTVPRCAHNLTCPYGLKNSFQILEAQSNWSSLITAGLLASTLSAALSSFLNGPRVFQAISEDRIFPRIRVFAKGYGPNKDPRYAYMLGFAVVVAVVFIGNLNTIAPLLSNFFLAAYALINFACFDGSFTNSPGFRPRFKFYNKWLSLFGALLCMTVMFVIAWMTALMTLLIFGSTFFYIQIRRPEVDWGSSREASNYRRALKAAYELASTDENIGSYRPQFLVLTGHPSVRPQLVDFVHNISKDLTLMLCGYVVPLEPSDAVFPVIQRLEQHINSWLRMREIKSFCVCVANPKIRLGVQTFLQFSGLGKLRPNILFLGFKSRWTVRGSAGLEGINDYVGTIQDGFLSNLGVCILRNETGTDHHACDEIQGLKNVKSCELAEEHEYFSSKPSIADGEEEIEVDRVLKDIDAFRSNVASGSGSICFNRLNHPEERSLYFRNARRAKRDRLIDVWWLFDDGGLTLLLPYLLTKERSYLEKARLRIFTMSKSPNEIELEQVKMIALLNKFRLMCSEVLIISDFGKSPTEKTKREFEELIAPFRAAKDRLQSGLITEAELESQKVRSNRHLRYAELLRERSRSADLVVLSLPLLRKSSVSSCLYMAWLEMLTRGLPPTLLVRGNQTSVLTFYS